MATLVREAPHAVTGYGHDEHEEEAARPQMNQVGLWLFFLSETFLFTSLLASRFYLAGTERDAHVDQVLGLGITSILLLSSGTAYIAEAAITQGKRGMASLFLFFTILLGVVFFGGVVVEWSIAEFHQSEPYGTAFFTMTGLHASHVLSGVVILGLVLLLNMRGRFSAGRHWGVEGSIKYWHFVDVVWVFFYPSLYLIQ